MNGRKIAMVRLSFPALLSIMEHGKEFNNLRCVQGVPMVNPVAQDTHTDNNWPLLISRVVAGNEIESPQTTATSRNKFCGITLVELSWLRDDEWYLIQSVPDEITLRN